jgi:uncharacterized membrane protein (UPF0127 family)
MRYIENRFCFLAIFLFIVSLEVLSVRACPIELPSTRVTIKGRHLTVEVAATPYARSCGLAHRSSMPENEGMLFVYPKPGLLSFWMKDTEIPLSIAFIDDAGRIISIQKMDPLQQTERYNSPRPARYALEVNQSWFEKQGIGIGDIAELNIPIPLDIR